MNLQIHTTTEKIKLIRYLITGEIKFCNLKNENFEKKKAKKLKKHNNFAFHGYLPKCHS